MESSLLYNSTQYSTAQQATQKEWQRYFDKAGTLADEDDVTVFDLNLALLMGGDLKDFWRYEGSLTTPPCTEGIIWTIFKQPIIFIEEEFKVFRQNIYFKDYRGPQPRYTRTVYRTFPNESLSFIPDYNCCGSKDPNKPSDQLTSSFGRIYCSIHFIFLAVLSFFLVL